MRGSVFGLFVALAPLSLAQVEIGPHTLGAGFTGRISAIATLPTDGNTYYIGAADGGAWKTINGGATWQNLTDTLPTSSIGSIAVANRLVIYVGTGEANYALHSRYGLGIYKTTNAGATWAHLGESVFGGRCISKIVPSYRNANLVYAAVTPAGGFPQKSAAKGHPGKDGALGVFRSTDGGVTWVHLTGLPNKPCTDLYMSQASSSVLFAAIGDPFGAPENGIYRTVDGGTTWTKLAGGLPTADVGRISISEARTNFNRIYALVTSVSDAGGGGADTLGAYRSDDFGNTWTPLAIGNIQSTYGWYLNCVGVSPVAPDSAFFGGLTLSRTVNGGASFTSVTPPHVDLHALTYDASGRLLAGCDGGVYRSSDNGATWTSLNNGIGTTQFYAGVAAHPTNVNIAIGGLQDNGTVIRPSATMNWNAVIGGDGGWAELNQVAPLNMWGQPQGPAQLRRSTNGGASFALASTGINSGEPNAFYTPVVYSPGSTTTLFCGTDRVYKSTNNGTNWTAVSADLTPTSSGAIRCLAVSPMNANNVWVATTDGVIARSTNGGVSFINSLTGIPGWIRVTREVVPSPTFATTCFLAVSQFGTSQVRRTTDNGATWTSIDGDLPDIPVNTIGIDPRPTPDVLYAGTESGLYKSVNDGVNWTKVPGLPNTPVIDLRYRATNGSLLIATQGRGAWTLSL
ncbi:MAG: hypothetical protein ABL949_04575 [Fimbriimonadaceae bacterium]